jgi:PAS domain S-box-containing protein
MDREFNRRIEAAQNQLCALLSQIDDPSSEGRQLMTEAMDVLSQSLEELQVAEEELRRQNQELAATQRALEVQRRRYRELFTFAPDGYLVTDAEGVIREGNRAAAALLGVRQDHLVGKPLSTFVPEERRARFYDLVSHLCTENRARPDPWETRLRPRDGEPFPAALTVAPVREGGDGELTGLRWLVRDVTARVEAQEALRESEERFAAVMNSMEAIMYVADMETYEVLFVNQYTRDLFGDIEGQICWQALQEGQTGPCDFCTNPLLLDERGEPTGVQTWDFQNTRTGHWYHIQDRAIRWIDGHWVRLEVATDITAHKRMEEALQKSEEQYRRLAESAEAVLWEYDVLEDRWTYVAPQVTRILGYPPEAWTGVQFWVDHIHPEDRAWARDYCFECASRGEPHTFEYRFLRPDGSIAWLRDEVSVEMESGRPVRLRGFMIDITERKQAEEQIEQYAAELERSNEDLEQFAYVVSHDLREPARMVNGFLELLESQYGDQLAPKAREYVDYAADGARRMQEMIRGLLDLSRIDTRGKEPTPAAADAILERTLRSLEPAIENAVAEVTYDPLPIVLADKTQLAQVFQNLIANAIKFHEEDQSPRVHVSAEPEGDEWVFSVEDNGIGIDPQQAPRIFQIFQRLHTRDEYEGLGIGLALCKRIVERHGGDIWFESDAGEGSTFYFTLPAGERVSTDG